jgi:hypothetical protein
VSVWSRKRSETAAWQKDLFNELRRYDRRIEMNRRCRGRREEVNRSGRRVRVRALHVDDTLIFGRLDFRKVRVHHRRSVRIGVHMEEWRIKCREYQRRNGAKGGYSSHGRNCVMASCKVNAAEAVYFTEQNFRKT